MNQQSDLIRYLVKPKKTTVFLTTHYLDEAEGVDRICVINHGKIVALGTPAKIKQELIEEYIEIDTKDRKKLIEELTKKKIDFKGDGPFTIELKDSEAHRILKIIDTNLNHINIHTPTLEEAYLEIISEQNDKDNVVPSPLVGEGQGEGANT